MSKYEPLRRHLQMSPQSQVRLSFAEIEGILGMPLPASARRHAAWWSNSVSSHVQAQAWLSANFETVNVSIPGETVEFQAVGRNRGMEEMQQAPLESTVAPPKRHPLFGSMKGTSIVAPGVDLTQPADPEWARVYDDDYDHGVIVERQDGKLS